MEEESAAPGTSVPGDEAFNTSRIAFTPSLNKALPAYRNPVERSAQIVAPPSTIVRPNYEGKNVLFLLLLLKSPR